MTKPKEICLPRKRKNSFSDWKWKISIWLNTFLIRPHFWKSVILLLTLLWKVQISKECKSNFEESFASKWWFFRVILTVFCFPVISVIPDILFINILNGFLFDKFLMIYDSILFTWFTKRFWILQFPLTSCLLLPVSINCKYLQYLNALMPLYYFHCYFVLKFHDHIFLIV